MRLVRATDGRGQNPQPARIWRRPPSIARCCCWHDRLHILLTDARSDPASRFADVADESAEYDVRVEADSAVEDARHGDPSGLARHDALEDVGWRYRIDPDGPSTHEEWVLRRHLHPMS